MWGDHFLCSNTYNFYTFYITNSYAVNSGSKVYLFWAKKKNQLI